MTVTAQHASAPASEPTAYTVRIVATGLAAAAGAVLTNLIDSRGTLVGAVVVAMTVSALGQAMRAPLDRLERRIKSLGLARGILIIGLVGFLAGAGAANAHELLQGRTLAARVARTLQPPSTEEPGEEAPTASVPRHEDTTTSATPAPRRATESDKESAAQPASPANRASEPVPSKPDQP